MKQCKECKKVKEFDKFQVAPSIRDGYSNTCYECMNQKRHLQRYNGATKVCEQCKTTKSLASYYGPATNKRSTCITCCLDNRVKSRNQSEYFEHDPYYKF